MNTADLEKLKTLIRRCLENAEDLLNSAKDSHSKKRNHIAFHLAVLALEEIGKASMLLGRALYPHVEDDENYTESKRMESLADHRKKLFWALLIPGMGSGIISPEDFTRLKEVANDIHLQRITSLYVDVDPKIPPVDVSDQNLEVIIRLTESRLALEQFKDIRQLDADAQRLLDWFMKTLSDPHFQSFILGEQSRQKLAELTGNSRNWMEWLQTEISTAENKANAAMEKEINRLAPTGVLANKPKWRLKIKLRTLSHSVRHKELNAWNEEVLWVKLYPTTNKSELLVEFLLPAKIPVNELWKVGSQMCSMFAVALNVATAGYFWWYLPDSPSSFYEDIEDLETKMKLAVDTKFETMNMKRTALKSRHLQLAGSVLTYLMMWATKEQSEAYSRYMHGIAMLSKNDVFKDFSEQALVDFANAFRIGLTSYGDWDGNRETFDKAASKVFDRLWNRQDFFEDFKSLMKCAEELEDKLPLSRPVRLDETMKLKTFCDCYLSSRAQFATQHAIAKGKSPMSSSEQWDSIDS